MATRKNSDNSIVDLNVVWRRQIRFWLITAFLFIAFLYVFRSILLPFVAGMALAYFLDPVADRLQKWKFSRLAATITILAGFLILFVIVLMLVIPVLATQLVDLLGRLPDYVSRIQSLVTDFDPVAVATRRLPPPPNMWKKGASGWLTSTWRNSLIE